MPRSFKLPDLGEGVHEGEVLRVLVSEGDMVNEDDPLLEVETDKAAVEIPSPFTGRVEKIHVKAGDIVKVGDVLVTFEDVQKDAGKKEEEKESAPADKDKKRERPARDAEKPGKAEEPGKEKPKKIPSDRPVPASPATRRLARELGVDLRQVSGTGPEGLVTSQDVKDFAEKEEGAAEEKKAEKVEKPTEKKEREKAQEEKEEKAKPLEISVPPMPDFSRWGPVEKVPVRSIRRATARQMSLSWSIVPHVSNQDEADITKLEAFRQKHKDKLADKGAKLTLTVFAIKAAATALKAYPYFNASFDPNQGEIILKNYYHIGVAVNTEQGLVVPVIRDVDRKSITEIAIELTDLADRARQRKISPEQMHGGTFTITNAGPMGGGHFAPIINYPEVAILGMGQARMKPVARTDREGNHRIVTRLMMPIVVCFDHRVQDGVDAIHFCRTIIDALEDPDQLFMTMV